MKRRPPRPLWNGIGAPTTPRVPDLTKALSPFYRPVVKSRPSPRPPRVLPPASVAMRARLFAAAPTPMISAAGGGSSSRQSLAQAGSFGFRLAPSAPPGCGARISAVHPESIAEAHAIRVDDVLTEVHLRGRRLPVQSPRAFQKMVPTLLALRPTTKYPHLTVVLERELPTGPFQRVAMQVRL